MTFRFHRRLVYWNIVILLVAVLVSGFNFPRSLFALAIGVLLTLLVSYALRLRVAAPLSELFTAIQRFGDGDLHQRVAVTGDPEISELVRATNTMVRNLEDIQNQLRGSQRKVDSFVDAMTEGVMLLDAGGRIVLANRAFSRMIASDRELPGKTTLDIFRNPELEQAIRSVLSGDDPRSSKYPPPPGASWKHISPNLIDNAVYYNRPSGEIRVSGARENGSFLLSIADTGEGIPPSDLQRIFERFYRVDKARSRDRGGTGLRLSIVKHAVESQGGSITVSSKLGAGSQFNIRLPIRRSE